MGKFKTSPLMNPLNQFITPAEQTARPAKISQKAPKPPKVKKQLRADDDRENPRTRRTQLLFRPALYDAVKAEGKKRGLSVNNFVEFIITQYMESVTGDK